MKNNNFKTKSFTNKYHSVFFVLPLKQILLLPFSIQPIGKWLLLYQPLVISERHTQRYPKRDPDHPRLSTQQSGRHATAHFLRGCLQRRDTRKQGPITHARKPAHQGRHVARGGCAITQRWPVTVKLCDDAASPRDTERVSRAYGAEAHALTLQGLIPTLTRLPVRWEASVRLAVERREFCSTMPSHTAVRHPWISNRLASAVHFSFSFCLFVCFGKGICDKKCAGKMPFGD